MGEGRQGTEHVHPSGLLANHLSQTQGEGLQVEACLVSSLLVSLHLHLGSGVFLLLLELLQLVVQVLLVGGGISDQSGIYW